MDEFVVWFTSHGATLDTERMGLVEFPGQSRGAVALQDIPENYTLFTIPRRLTLSMRTSELPSHLGEPTWRRMRFHKGWVGLILCMMWEEAQGEKSPWYGYLRMLPTEFDTPMFWSSDELRELEGTAILDKIGKDKAERDYHERLVPAVQSRPDLFDPSHLSSFYSLQNYHNKGSCILSRSFQVEEWGSHKDDEDDHISESITDVATTSELLLGKIITPTSGDGMEVDGQHDDDINEKRDEPYHEEESDDEDGEDPSDVAMVPMADMLNARYGSENAKLFYEPTVLKMITTRAITKGEQIFNTYGNLPNSDLLRRYGHVDIVPVTYQKSEFASTSTKADDREEILGNPADVVEVPADLALAAVTSMSESSGSSTLSGSNADWDILKERIDWWLEEGGDDVFVIDGDSASTPGGITIPPGLISFLRLLSISEEWERAKERGKPPKPHLDATRLALIREIFLRRLSRYPTALKEDELLLLTFPPLTATLSSDLSRARRRTLNALVVRMGEKRLLHRTLERVEELISEESSRVNGKGDKGRTKSSEDGRVKRKKEEKGSGSVDRKEKRVKK